MADDKASRFGLHRDGDVVLRDGSTVRIRVMRPSDEAAFARCSHVAVRRITLAPVLLPSE
jgi:hypothetical protein